MTALIVTAETQPTRLVRTGLLVLQALVALTAVSGGIALILGSLNADLATVLNPPPEYLEGTPFTSYVVPGLILAVVIGGLHGIGFVLGITRHALALIGAAAAGFALLIWVFVQMVFIPFSFLQVVYFAFGVAEVGAVMLALGILRTRSQTT